MLVSCSRSFLIWPTHAVFLREVARILNVHSHAGLLMPSCMGVRPQRHTHMFRPSQVTYSAGASQRCASCSNFIRGLMRWLLRTRNILNILLFALSVLYFMRARFIYCLLRTFNVIQKLQIDRSKIKYRSSIHLRNIVIMR